MIPTFLFAVAVSSKLASSSGPPSDVAESPRVIEVHRTIFDRPYRPGRNVVSPFAPVVYAFGRDTLFVVSAVDGTIENVVPLDTLIGQPVNLQQSQVDLDPDPADPKLVVYPISGASALLLSVADPVHPRLERRLDPAVVLVQPHAVVPGGRYALAYRFADGAHVLVDLDTGDVAGTLPVESGIVASGGTADRPLVTVAVTPPASPRVTTVSVFDVSHPSSPSLVYRFTTPTTPGRVLLDRSGEVVVFGIQSGYQRFDFLVYDARTGILAGAFGGTGNGYTARLAEGGDRRVLIWASPDGVQIVDLTSLADAHALPWIPLAIGGVPDEAIQPSPTAPLAFIETFGQPGIVAIDTSTGSILGQMPIPDGTPTGFDVAETAGTSRSGAVAVWRNPLPPGVTSPAGAADLRLLDLDDPAHPAVRARASRPGLREPQGAAIGGALVVAYDAYSDTLDLFDPKSGAILDQRGRDGSLEGSLAQLIPGDPYFAIYSEQSNAGEWEVLTVDGGKLRQVSRGSRTGRPVWGARMLHDGSLVFRGGDYPPKVEVHSPDGGGGTVPVYSQTFTDAFSPDERRMLVPGISYVPGFTLPSTMIDLSDPATPRILWTGLDGTQTATFDATGDRVLAFSTDQAHSDVPVLADAANASYLGEPGEPLSAPYPTPGLAFGTGDDARIVVTQHSFSESTLVFDVRGTTPVLSERFDSGAGISQFLRRSEDGGYQFSWFYGPDIPSEIRFFDAGSEPTSERLPAAVFFGQSRTVRYGFFTTATEDPSGNGAVSLWRDTAVNRPPVAVAGGNRTLECSGPEGTPVHLDGSASTDPDSTPGTNDDIVSYAWSGAGQSANGAEADLALPLGETGLSLTVTDALGLSASDTAAITVQDTLPPDVSIDLQPVIAGGVWAHLWSPEGSAVDRCDGDLGAPAERLDLPDGAATAETRYVPAAALSIELRRLRSGDLVAELEGPDEAAVRADWGAATAGAGFPLADRAPVGLVLAPAGTGRDASLVARFDLDTGGALARATAYGEGADLAVDATAMDAAGHAATAVTSLRATGDAICAAAPDNAICVGFGATASSPSSRFPVQSGRVTATLR